ncbi:hypothetical protein [Iningainema tapete]|uniref:Uncharacterized protein n=1 Tax=Iningainema tapete BLCC-T55 TaxID=2748662 RepID=A0A8J6XK24_9CYAN|nr:hypothetical protein [Iningainema tapete]MBD2771817.1 hypothetical protein [Iningainema tapete BLCC-T55]
MNKNQTPVAVIIIAVVGFFAWLLWSNNQSPICREFGSQSAACEIDRLLNQK